MSEGSGTFFKCQMKELSTQILYLAEIFFMNEREIKCIFTNIRKLREFVTSRPTFTMAKGSSLSRKEKFFLKKGTLDHQERTEI